MFIKLIVVALFAEVAKHLRKLWHVFIVRALDTAVLALNGTNRLNRLLLYGLLILRLYRLNGLTEIIRLGYR